jgi:hypothetical protein
MLRFQDHLRVIVRGVSVNWGAVVVLIPCVVALLVVEFAIGHRTVSEWIARAAEVEFASSIESGGTAPTQIAEPIGVTRTARSN